ncbi:MAG TPA: glycosyltransferase family A protein [Tepidisphaeraceae bacterium]
MNAAVSIIVPTHNRGDLLMQTLASVRAQTVLEFECVIVDDHSTDDTLARLAPLLASDERFKLIQLTDQRGAQAARNAGIAGSIGPLVMLLDSDDLLAPFCLQQRLPVMRADPKLDFAIFPCECFQKAPGDVGKLWNIPTAEADLDRFLKLDVPWQTTSPIWRRDAITALLPWPLDVPSGQDWEFHIRALLAGQKYVRAGQPDHYWRMAESERESIGKQSFKPEMLRSRVGVNAKVLSAVRAAGQLTLERRDMFAGMFFQSAERIAQRASRKEGKAIWQRALELELITPSQCRQGKTYLTLHRWPSVRGIARKRLEKQWPAAFFVKRSPTYLNAPVQSAPAAEVAA